MREGELEELLCSSWCGGGWVDGAEHCRGDRAEDGAGSRKDDDGTEGTGGDLEPAGN